MQAVVDYETKSCANLKVVGAIEYAKHESTSIFCVGYRVDEGPYKIWIPERAPMPDDLWECFKSGIIIAHNAGFERAVTRYVLTRYDTLTSRQKKVLSNIPPSQWRCTAAKAAACSLPRRLEHAAKVLELPTQKDLRGHKLILKYSKPRRPSKKNKSLWWSDKKDLRDIYKYCITDVKAEWELDQALPDLTPYEQKVWELDQRINDRGILIDIPTVKIILKMIHIEMGNITKGVRALSGGTIEEATQRDRVLKWLNLHGAEMSNLRAATIRDKLLEPDLDPNVRLMLEYRQGASRTSTAKYLMMLRVVGSDHRARELLLYCGAQVTGRWAGKRLQPHNFPRPTIKDFNSDEAIELIKSGGITAIAKKYGKEKVMDVLVSCIRGMIISAPGKDLFCADFAAIEARLAFWVAEHEEGLKAFREKRKIYEEMAAETFEMDIKDIGKNSLERFIGKESVLGCQYGLGWKKFLKNCHQKGMPDVTEEIAKKAVYTYRSVHHPVPSLWKNIENATIRAIQNPGKVYELNKVAIYVKNNFLNIKLPSGRRLRYFKPRLSQKQLAGGRLVPQIHHWGVDHHQWCEVVTWGGVLVNNIVQGIARDLMANGMINIEEAGYEFLLTVHDEGLAERDTGKGSLKEYIYLVSGKLPKWADGAPITSEGWVSKRYRK